MAGPADRVRHKLGSRWQQYLLRLVGICMIGGAQLASASTPGAFPAPAPQKPGDGINNVFGVFFAPTNSYWEPIAATHRMLVNKGADPANLFVLLTTTGTPPTDAQIVDGTATRATVSAAIAYCAEHMDADDIFLWQMEAHGNGYLGWTADEATNRALHGYVGGVVRTCAEDDELDFKESEFDFSVLCAAGGALSGRDFHYGLGTWGVRYYPRFQLVRFLALSHFTDLPVEGIGNLSDSDVNIERFTSYFKGDLNKNGNIDAGEVLDWDGDGIPPYDEATGAFDEDDWGPISRFEDNVTLFHSGLGDIPFRIIDANLDNTLDIDLYPSGEVTVDGTDLDNNGCIDRIDLNRDGDFDDWVAVDETVSIYADRLTDDEIGSYLDALTNGVKIILTSTCYGGGFVDDLSGENIIVIAGSREISEAPAGFLHEQFVRAFTTHATQADKDGNGRVSILEAFNLASLHPGIQTSPGMDLFHYDDNGDRYAHQDPLPNGGDGALGAITFFDRNRAPAITSTPPEKAPSQSTFRYLVVATDADGGDPLEFTLVDAPEWLTLQDNGNRTAVLSGPVGAAELGSVHTITLAVKDRLGLTGTQTFSITISPENVSPAFASASFTLPTATEAQVYSQSIASQASDPEGDAITFSKVSGAGWLVVNGNGTISGTPGAGDVGDNQFVVAVTDAYGATAQATVVISVLRKNLPPVFTSSSFIMPNAMEGVLYSETIAGKASDPHGDALTYSKVSGPAWLTINGDGSISGTPTTADINLWSTFKVRATDPRGLFAEAWLYVYVNKLNKPPQFSQSPIVLSTATEGTAWSQSISMYASDPDAGDVITFSKVSGPQWVSVSSSGQVLGVPSLADVGTNTFVVRASDGRSASEATVIVEVIKRNTAPRFSQTSFAMPSATEGTAWSQNISSYATDPDAGDVVTFRKISGPQWLIVSANGQVSGTPSLVDVGSNTFVVRATDNRGAYGEATLTVQVVKRNTPPQFSQPSFAMPAATEGTAWSQNISSYAFDADAGDVVSFSKVSGPQWLIVSANGQVSGTPSLGDVGSNTFVVRVTDNRGAYGDATLTVQVVKRNTPPQFSQPSFAMPAATEGTAWSQNISSYAFDADAGDVVSFSKVSGPEWLAISAAGQVSGTPALANVGTNTFVIRASDGRGGYSDGTMTVQVEKRPPVNDFATVEVIGAGTKSGQLSDTYTSNNVYEVLSEVLSSNNTKTGYSYLEHQWTINVTGGNKVTFNLEAHRTNTSDAESFVVAYSTDGVNYSDLVTVTKTSDNNTLQSVSLPTTTRGNIYIRARDTNRTGGKRTIDQLYVDRLFVVSE